LCAERKSASMPSLECAGLNAETLRVCECR
jgi:hypothetical protein